MISPHLPVLALAAALLAAPAPAAFNYWHVSDTLSTPPALISQTGAYADAAAKKLIPEARYFEVNSALWSDASAKLRWVLVKPGRKIAFKEKDDYYDYPDSTVFIKHFMIDTVPGDTLTRVHWETRFLVLKKRLENLEDPGSRLVDRWYGFSYKWRADGKEADLVPAEGAKAAIRWYPKGRGAPAEMKKWFFPATDMCSRCHRVTNSEDMQGRSVLGFFTAQLNRPHPLKPSVNQIDSLFLGGTLGGTRPADFAALPRWRALEDSAATVEQRALSYIAANCSGCHGSRGMAVGASSFIKFNFDYHEGVTRFEFRKSASWDYGLDALAPDSVKAALVRPGHPDKSILLFRQKQRNYVPADSEGAYETAQYQMPPLATYEIHEAARALLARWITEMPPVPLVGDPIAARDGRASLLSPAFQGRFLVLPREMAPGLLMASLDGRVLPLRKAGEGVYAVPERAPSGVYVIRAGGRVFRRHLP